MKRFSSREIALLLLSVAAMGAMSWWALSRPIPPVDDGKLHPRFRVEAPSALEAFGGADAIFVIEVPGAYAWNVDIQPTPFLQVKTPRGVQTTWAWRGSRSSWGHKIWNSSTFDSQASRFVLSTRGVPAGEVHFGLSGVAQPFASVVAASAPTAPPKPLHLSGKWKVNRSQIQPLNLAAWPRKPLAVLQEVRITHISPDVKVKGFHSLSAECVFALQGASVDANTSFESSFSEHHSVPRKRSRFGPNWTAEPGTPRTRVRKWIVNENSTTTEMIVSGRVSADNRWPLGFEIEPFDFKNARVGQKLKFRQFPVPLPK